MTYTYTGYAMVRQARDLIDAGEIGNILTVVSEYPQEWLLVQMVSDRSDQATWRMDPAKAVLRAAVRTSEHMWNVWSQR